MGSVAQVVGSVVGSISGSVVGSMMGRGSVGVGGCGDHDLTGSSAHVHLLTKTQVAVTVSGVIGSVAQVVGSVVGSMGGSVVGSMMGRGSVGVGGCGDHGLTGNSAHVHLLTMTNAPLVLAASITVARSVASSVSISTIAISSIAAIS